MKECEGENTVSSLLVKILRQQENYEGMLKKDDELWVVIPSRVDRIDCNGEL